MRLNSRFLWLSRCLFNSKFKLVCQERPEKSDRMSQPQTESYTAAKGGISAIKESYHEFKEIYSNCPIIENNKIQNVVTEDSNSGYHLDAR